MKIRCCIRGLLLLGVIGWAAESVAQSSPYAGYQPVPMGYRTCQILDHSSENLFAADAAYLYQADLDDGTRAGFIEISAKGNMAYFRWPFGDILLNSDLRGIWIVDSGSDLLPNQLFMLRLPVSWIKRYHDGIATKVTIQPGVHGDGESVDGQAVFIPVSLSVIRAFAMDFSGIAGVEFRSGFERSWFPIFGAVWQPYPSLRIEALLPRGGVEVALGRDWRLHAAYAWESTDYRLHDWRRQITLEDFRLSAGLSRVMHSDLELTAEAGYVMSRRLTIHRPETLSLDPEDSFFIRVGVAAPF